MLLAGSELQKDVWKFLHLKMSTVSATATLLYGQAFRQHSPMERHGAFFSSGVGWFPQEKEGLNSISILRFLSWPPDQSSPSPFPSCLRAGERLDTGSSTFLFLRRVETGESLPYFLQGFRTQKQMNSSKESGIGKKFCSVSWQVYEFNPQKGSKKKYCLIKRNGSNLSELDMKLHFC